MKKSKKNKRKSNNKIFKFLKKNKQFSILIVVLIIIFIRLVIANLPVTKLDRDGLMLLNAYEYPTYKITSDNCMAPYDVGDGVITFGPGITYPTIEQGLNAINQSLGTNYTVENSCIKTDDLLELQQIILVEYEQIVINFADYYNLELNQDQFNGLVLLSYNSPNIFKNQGFIQVLTDPNSTIDQYVTAADNYYQQLSGYDTQYGSGWYNRVIDSAQAYYNGDYEFQNS